VNSPTGRFAPSATRRNVSLVALAPLDESSLRSKARGVHLFTMRGNIDERGLRSVTGASKPSPIDGASATAGLHLSFRYGCSRPERGTRPFRDARRTAESPIAEAHLPSK